MSTSIPDLAKQLEAERLALDAAKKQMCRLMIHDGQATAAIQLFGREIALTYLDANTGYQVRCVPGRRDLLDAVIAVQREFVISVAGRVEGLEFQLAKAAKALAQGGAA